MGPDMSEQLEQLTAQIARMDARLAVLTDAVTAMARMHGTRQRSLAWLNESRAGVCTSDAAAPATIIGTPSAVKA